MRACPGTGRGPQCDHGLVHHPAKGERIDTELTTTEVVHRYHAAWTSGDLDSVRELLALDVTVECNLGWSADPEHLLRSLDTLASALEEVSMLSETYDGGRVLLLYDCRIRQPEGIIRTLEAITVADGRIREVRRTYDLTAVRDLLPSLTPRNP